MKTLSIKASSLIKEIKVDGQKVEKDALGDLQLVCKLSIKMNKKRIFFLKIISVFYNLFRLPVEIIDDLDNTEIKFNPKNI